jgi:hypothetical protein
LYSQPTDTSARAATAVVVTASAPLSSNSAAVACRTRPILSWLRDWAALRRAPTCDITADINWDNGSCVLTRSLPMRKGVET